MKLISEREEILKYSNLLLEAGLIHNGQGNISVFNRNQGLAAITPSAVPYQDRDLADICIVDLEGNLVEGNWKPTSETPMHLIYYQQREDVNAVVHTHAPKTTVFGIIGDQPLPMVLNEAAMCIGGPVPIAPYARPGTKELAQINIDSMGDGVAVILAHHGLITVGSSLEWAYLTSIAVESTAAAIILARSMGNDPIALDNDEVHALREIIQGYKPKKV